MRTLMFAAASATALALSPMAFAQQADIRATTMAAQTDQNDNPEGLATIVERMARIGFAHSPSFSPDGQKIAFISDLSGTPQVWIVPTQGGWPTLITSGEDPVTNVHWSPKGDWLALAIAPGGGMNTQIYLVRPDSTGLRRLTLGGKDNNRLGRWTEDGTRFAVSSNRRAADSMDGYLVNPDNGQLQLVAKNEGIGAIANLSNDNRRALVFRMRSRTDNDLYLLDLRTDQEALLTPHEGPGEFDGGISPDGKTVYLSSNKDRDRLAFARIRLAENGEPGPIEIVAERPDAELGSFKINHSGTTAALLWNVGGRAELTFVDLSTDQTTSGPKLPAELAGGLTFSRDDKLLAMTTSGSVSPTDIWVLDLTTKRFHRVTHAPHAGVDLAQLIRPELVTFKAHDGLQLSGWLYRPKGRSGAGAYVIDFHGGPELQEVPYFRNDYQALLSQGIGVFAPNVRGSKGFGKRFLNLDNGELRFNAIGDIKSCVDYLISSGVADPKRIGITGGSYGGYMTMAGVTEYPDLFAAGVDLFGIVNFATFFAHTEPWMAAISTIKYGDPKTQADLLQKLSPINKLDRIKAAIMLQHGANDTNVPVEEAEQIVNNLKQRGMPVQYVLFPDEGHGFRKIPNRIRSIVDKVEFFVTYLRPSNVRAVQ
jgi:dipeptidyl aminopeptidase/acylaminoacyl peptidase